MIINPGSGVFANTTNHDYHLAPGSPAINAGFSSGVLFDKDGVGRGTPPDLGAYEN